MYNNLCYTWSYFVYFSFEGNFFECFLLQDCCLELYCSKIVFVWKPLTRSPKKLPTRTVSLSHYQWSFKETIKVQKILLGYFYYFKPLAWTSDQSIPIVRMWNTNYSLFFYLSITEWSASYSRWGWVWQRMRNLWCTSFNVDFFCMR